MQVLRRCPSALALLLVLTAIGSILGCYSRRQMATTRLTKIDIRELEFLVLDGTMPKRQVWVLSNLIIGEQALSARFDRASVPLIRQISDIRSNADLEGNRHRVLIYLRPSAVKISGDTSITRLDYHNVAKIEVFEPDAGKTVGVALAITVGSAIAVGLITLLIACNCPHVYAEAPAGTHHLEGSLYSGAIYPSLERSDYLPLQHLQAVDGQYHIRLANQESQHQHTNLLALEVLDHAPGLRPMFDKYGQLHSLASPQAPLAATDVSGKNVLGEVLVADEKIFVGDLENARPEATERLTLTFAKPAQARQAKLVLNAKNSDWLDYTYFEFQNALGQYADAVARKYRRLSAAENLAWAERQKIPLAVWLETTPGHWEKADYFQLAGASTFRRDVLSLDLARVQGDFVRVRLEFGFRFWEIDYAALDCSADQPVRQTTLRPIIAVDQKGADVTAALTDDDDRYYGQPQLGDEARVAFEVPPLVPGQVRSLVLRAKGHYEVLHPPAPGRPSLSHLKAWSKENALPRLSRERWRQIDHRTVNQ